MYPGCTLRLRKRSFPHDSKTRDQDALFLAVQKPVAQYSELATRFHMPGGSMDLGYARVSKAHKQDAAAQLRALQDAGASWPILALR